MDKAIQKALENTLEHWEQMTRAEEEAAEASADEFETSFYQMMDVVRDWIDGLQPRPQSMEQLLELPDVRALLDRLPQPLHLNFETEAELILDRQHRIEEDKME